MGANKPNPLKTAIFQAGLSQREVAMKVGIDTTRMSNLANDWIKPTDDEKKKLARVLKLPVEQLFPEALSA